MARDRRTKGTALRVRLVPIARREAEQNLNEALDLLADGLADQVLDQARIDTAERLGIDPESLKREDPLSQQVRHLLLSRGMA